MGTREGPRRTQAERRAATIRRLLDAATAALVEVGYAGTTVQEICRRAGVSHGGLFRHFATREALLVAVAEDVGAQVMGTYRRRFEAGTGPRDRLPRALELLRQACRSRPNQAWFELATAARTDAALRRAMKPLALAYYGSITDLARALLPELVEAWGAHFEPLVEVLVAVFDGEQLRRLLADRRGADAQRMEALLVLLGGGDPGPAASR